MMLAVRAPQLQPAMVTLSILTASMKVMISRPSADWWPFRNVTPERNIALVESQQESWRDDAYMVPMLKEYFEAKAL